MGEGRDVKKTLHEYASSSTAQNISTKIPERLEDSPLCYTTDFLENFTNPVKNQEGKEPQIKGEQNIFYYL